MSARGLRIVTALFCLSLGTFFAAHSQPTLAADPVLVGAGDIADCTATSAASSGAASTAALLNNISGTVFTLGDNAYDLGTAAQFSTCYDPTWGQFLNRTYPAPGNHDYGTSGAAPYYAYFGARAGTAGKGYYSYDLGTWHIVSLNSEVDASETSAQVQWLRDDLALHRTACTLAYWHKPLYSSGEHGNILKMQQVWNVLYENGADVVLAGHDHNYERFAPQDAYGRADPKGMREFVVGTGGAHLRSFSPPMKPNSEAADSTNMGVLKLTLRAAGYDWEFLPIGGKPALDTGSAACYTSTNTAAPVTPYSVAPTVETVPVPHPSDAADDPAIWIHPTNTGSSTILGTDKGGGLAVYNLDGSQLQYLADGEINNVDLRYNFPLNNQRIALVTAGNRTNNTIAIYRVDPTTRLLTKVAARDIVPSISIYGSCMYRSPSTGKYYVFINDKNGAVQQWELFGTANGTVDAQQVRSFSLGSQTEGCVADDELGWFYIGEEAIGIWKYGAEPTAGDAHTIVDATGATGHLTSNVEGLSLYYGSNGTGYLLASSQGSDSYVIYQREANNAYLATFNIAAGNGIDRVSGTDGIDVTNAALGSAFPQGLFVAQDSSNDNGNQNFKLVPWQSIANSVAPPLTIDTVWDPRQVGAGAAPTITQLSPASASAGSPGFTLTINGANFMPGTTVRWNGVDKPTTFINSINLSASISAADIAASGTVSVVIANPAPENTVSNPVTFTITNAPTPTPVGNNAPIKSITFESGSLVNATTGVDSTSGTLTLQTSAPLKDSYSVSVPDTISYGFLTQNFSAVDEVFVSFYVKPANFPASARIAMVQNSGTTVGNLVLSTSGTLQLRNGSTAIGSLSPALSKNTLYRVGLHQRKGSGSDGLLEAYLAEGDSAFGAPFASSASQSFTTQANKFLFGATNSNRLDATFDDIKLDSKAMPAPSGGIIIPTVTNTPSSTPTSTPTSTDTPTNTSTSTDTPTNTPPSPATNTPIDSTATPANTFTSTPTSTPTSTNTPTSTPTSTPVGNNAPIKSITFESGSLVNATTGVDSTSGTLTLQTSAPLKDSYSVSVPDTISYGFLTQNFSAVDEVFVSFYIKPATFPASARIAMFQSSGTTVGNLVLSTSGTLQLRNGSTAIGSPSPALSKNTLYRVGLHQRKGSGSDGLLEAYLAVGDSAFGAPFASSASQSFTTQANKFLFGATNSNRLDATFDDIKLDSKAMPAPSGATTNPTATAAPASSPTPTPTRTATSTPPPASGNLLANGGFELDANSDARPDSWTSNSRFTRITTPVRSGTYAGKHTATNNANYTISQQVSNLQAGQFYTFSSAVNIPTTSDTFSFKLDIQWRNASGSTISTTTIKTYTATTNGWNQITASLSAAPAGTTNAQVRMVVSSLNATVYVDDFVLQAGSSAP